MKVKVEFEIYVDDNIKGSDQELEDWLRFELRDNGCLDGSNPFRLLSADPIFGTFEWDEA